MKVCRILCWVFRDPKVVHLWHQAKDPFWAELQCSASCFLLCQLSFLLPSFFPPIFHSPVMRFFFLMLFECCVSGASSLAAVICSVLDLLLLSLFLSLSVFSQLSCRGFDRDWLCSAPLFPLFIAHLITRLVCFHKARHIFPPPQGLLDNMPLKCGWFLLSWAFSMTSLQSSGWIIHCGFNSSGLGRVTLGSGGRGGFVTLCPIERGHKRYRTEWDTALWSLEGLQTRQANPAKAPVPIRVKAHLKHCQWLLPQGRPNTGNSLMNDPKSASSSDVLDKGHKRIFPERFRSYKYLSTFSNEDSCQQPKIDSHI